VALPGGKREEGDADDVQTALREAKEEIGLDPSLVSVITPLQPCHTRVFLPFFIYFFHIRLLYLVQEQICTASNFICFSLGYRFLYYCKNLFKT